MKVRCICANAGGLPESYLRDDLGITSTTEFYLTVGKVYTVYAMDVFEGLVRYYVCEEESPMPQLCPLFKVLDGRISNYWQFKYVQRTSDHDPAYTVTRHELAFPEWLQQLDFFERLLNDGLEELEVFRRYKRLMDAEFPNQT